MIEEIKELLNKNEKHVVIVTHKNPDGDAMGSALGLYHYFANKGIDARVITPNKPPKFLRWMPGDEKVIYYCDNQEEVERIFRTAGMAFFLDFNVLNRLGELAEKVSVLSCPKVLIDHHPYPEMFADLIISNTEVSSTCELIYSFIEKIGGKDFFNLSIAQCLYTGIITDTGGLSYNSSRNETYEIVGKLIKLGISKEKIHSNIYDNYSADRMRLLGYCLNNKMKVFPAYRTAYISIKREELEEFNFSPGDSEGFVNYPLSIKDIVFSAIFIEYDNYVKISFRSKGSFPANKFSNENFNGGGHINAAGGESYLSLEETLQKFEGLLPKYFKLMN